MRIRWKKQQEQQAILGDLVKNYRKQKRKGRKSSKTQEEGNGGSAEKNDVAGRTLTNEELLTTLEHLATNTEDIFDSLEVVSEKLGDRREPESEIEMIGHKMHKVQKFTQTTKLEVGELRKDIQALTGTVRRPFSNQSQFSQQGKSHNSAFAPSSHLKKLTLSQDITTIKCARIFVMTVWIPNSMDRAII